MNTIVFILNNLADTHSHVRIQEFIANGYQVKVYGCQREGIHINKQYPYPLNAFGTFQQRNYIKRLGVLLKAVRTILKETDKDDIYYCFGLDNAMALYLQSNRKFIYEEADLSHTYIAKKMIVNALEWVDKRVIKKSLLTVFTSDGYLQYHYGGKCPANGVMIYNKLSPAILKEQVLPHKQLDVAHLKFGFVGDVRGVSVYQFAKVIGDRFPQHEVHFYGYINKLQEQLFHELEHYPNIVFHGRFCSPVDLPRIYSEIDIAFATYDAAYDNIRYAEPNKLYEAIYFEAPFIVSSHTFLAEKVRSLGIGFDVDATDEEAVCRLVNGLTAETIKDKVQHAAAIDKKATIDENGHFFAKLKKLLA